ncbi:MAG: hypothetical protein O7D28_02265, partial [Actinobacteria bacterium]|nr:hypothetical protein [Actinomycetota bacterium]
MSSLALKFLMVLVGGVALGVLSFAWWNAAEVPVSANPPEALDPTTTTVPPTTTTTVPPTTTSTVPPSTTTTEPPRGMLVIHGTGDVTVDPTYIPALKSRGWDHAWSGLEGLFVRDDLT